MWRIGRLNTAKPFLDRCSVQGKSNMALKIIPVERKQSLQIGILEKLAVCFVAFLIPASALAGLIVMRSASQSNRMGSDGRLTPLQYQKSEHLAHIFKEAACLSHPWHVFVPFISIENFWTWSLNASNLFSDSGNICGITLC